MGICSFFLVYDNRIDVQVQLIIDLYKCERVWGIQNNFLLSGKSKGN